MTWALGIALRPFGALLIFGCIALPIRMAIAKWVPEGKIKDTILKPRFGKHRDKFMRKG